VPHICLVRAGRSWQDNRSDPLEVAILVTDLELNLVNDPALTDGACEPRLM
jgi:hypothetical protein